MKKKRSMRKIGFVLLALVTICAYSFFYFSALSSVLVSINWLAVLFLMLLYAVIPGTIAVILRIKLGEYVLKWIALAATITGSLCLIIIAVGVGSILDIAWISTLVQFTLVSSVPVLYCIVFLE